MNEDERRIALAAVNTERRRLAGLLTACVLVMYFGFILLIAFDKPLMGTVLTEGLSLGILMGALVIIMSWVLTLIYVRWANKVYDEKISKLRR